jgi:periplasmic protein TonB
MVENTWSGTNHRLEVDMKLTLPESQRSRKRRTGGVGMSVVLHVVVLGAAMVSAARPEPAPKDEREIMVVAPVVPEPEPQRTPETARPGDSNSGQVPSVPIPVLEPPDIILPGIPDVTTYWRATGPDDFERRALGAPSGGSGGLHAPVVSAEGVFDRETVERAVVALPGNTPRYPSVLQEAGVEGTVVMQFVVDTAGRIESRSVRTVRSDHAMFERAVMDALPRMRFVPAEVGGRKVRQLVEQAFGFVRK